MLLFQTNKDGVNLAHGIQCPPILEALSQALSHEVHGGNPQNVFFASPDKNNCSWLPGFVPGGSNGQIKLHG